MDAPLGILFSINLKIILTLSYPFLSLTNRSSDNEKRCKGPIKCGKNKFCVGFENDRVYCYGSTHACLWNLNDCQTDQDCKKYSSVSPKLTDGDVLSCLTTPSGWRADACTCKSKLHFVNFLS